MKKTFELEEYHGLKWTTLSNPEDATHPWGVGTEVWFEAGTNEDGSVNLWDWKTKTYGNAESVRPVPPADDVQDGEIVEEQDTPFELTGGAATQPPPASDQPPQAPPAALVALQRKADTWLMRAKVMLKSAYPKDHKARVTRLLSEAGVVGPIGACASSEALERFIAGVDAALNAAAGKPTGDEPF